MSAGAVRAPLIIPLRLPTSGQFKNVLDTKTRIDISSDTPEAKIYFTIDGSRPDPSKFKLRRPYTGPTYLFQNPFALPAGLKVVKAVAFLPSTTQESSIVTKTFEVQQTEESNSTNKTADEVKDDYGFLEELRVAEKAIRHKSVIESPVSTDVLKKANQFQVNANNGPLLTPILKKNSQDENSYSREDLTHDKTNMTRLRNSRSEVNENGDRRPLSRISDSRHQCDPMHKEVELLKCPNCYAARSADMQAVFCRTCGSALPRIPTNNVSSPQIGRLGTCGSCGCTCSLDANMCLVCEAPISTSSHQQTRKSSDYERKLCPTCGSLNPVKINSCLTCEAVLPQGQSNLINISSLIPRRAPRSSSNISAWNDPTISELPMQKTFLACCVCHRQTSLDSRFCDWCGTKDPGKMCFHSASSFSFANLNVPQNSHETLTNDQFGPEDNSYIVAPPCRILENSSSDFISCGNCCFSQNPKHSRYCSRCGMNISEPLRTSMFSPPTSQPWSTSNKRNTGIPTYANSSVTELKNVSTTFSAASTQTVGLYYPSSADMRRNLTDNQLCRQLEKDYKSRAALIAPISPGRGYWRMQLEHILVHMKAYTKNNADFRSILGTPRLGKLMSAGVEEENDELTIFLTFKNNQKSNLLPDSELNETGLEKPPNYQKNNNSYNEKNLSGMSSDRSAVRFRETSVSNGQSQIGNRLLAKQNQRFNSGIRNVNKDKLCTNKNANQIKMSTKKKLHPTSFDGLTEIYEQKMAKYFNLDSKLLKEIQCDKQNNIDSIIRLLEEGADPSCVDSNGDPAILIAVQRRYLKAIRLIAESGADVNAIGNRSGNSSLHEAILLGPGAEEIVEILLRFGADANLRNDDHLSSYDLATRMKLGSVVRMFATAIPCQPGFENYTLPNGVSE